MVKYEHEKYCNSCEDTTDIMYSTFDDKVYCNECMQEYDWDYIEEVEEVKISCDCCHNKINLNNMTERFIATPYFWAIKHPIAYCGDCYDKIIISAFAS